MSSSSDDLFTIKAPACGLDSDGAWRAETLVCVASRLSVSAARRWGGGAACACATSAARREASTSNRHWGVWWRRACNGAQHAAW